MATIRKRSNSYHVQIRKLGYPTLTKSFRNKATLAITNGPTHE